LASNLFVCWLLLDHHFVLLIDLLDLLLDSCFVGVTFLDRWDKWGFVVF
jgi:hypothetical protein